MQKISSLEEKQRIPPIQGGIQVNYCKNPLCKNYGVPALESLKIRKGRVKDNYTIVAAGKSYPVLKCHSCGEFPPIKSNDAILEEKDRLFKYLKPETEPSCPNTDCDNSKNSINQSPKSYSSFGKTKSGSKRYKCKSCGKTFSVGVSTLRQKQPHKNKLIFKLLMNKMPLKRICEMADVKMPTVYAKINFLRDQCLKFSADRERHLVNGKNIPRLYIGVDRQEYIINWSKRQDKRNVKLSAVGSADNETGYVFGMHLNFNANLDSNKISKEVIESGDCFKQPPFRLHAGKWLACDYDNAIKKKNSNRLDVSNNGVLGDIASTYDEAIKRDNLEDTETTDKDLKLPAKGMQIHSEYTLYGHFFFLKELFSGVDKIRFFLDQDSGMRAACLGAFCQDIKGRKCDAFYVKINKSMTVTEKKQSLSKSRKAFSSIKAQHENLETNEIKLVLIKEEISRMSKIGKWKDKWLLHPFPNMSEPEKAVCYLTDYNDYDEDHEAWLYNKASTHGIDRFFMQVRRRLSLLERPIGTASAANRIWYGYSAYNPESVIKLLDMFRVYYNYCLAGQDGKTPAMRIGLAKGVVTPEDIIYFKV